MQRRFLLIASVLFTATVALAQAGIGYNSAVAAQDQNPQVVRTPANSRATVVRGCLSGSPGNYTLTDPNGMQYRVTGDATLLRSMVGHEVEIKAFENQASGSARAAPNRIQASGVRSASNRCTRGVAVGTRPFPAANGANPKNPQGSTVPPKR
jgi:hypothetical protein